MAPLDLTPFGFTQTESLVYGVLTGLGPASGYAVARAAGIARANTYQALNGLVAKGAAVTIATAPLRFRAVKGDAVFARIAEDSARRIDRLEQQVRNTTDDGADAIVPVGGTRALADLAVRLIARAEGTVRCIAPGSVLAATTPAWRKRAADGARSAIWSLGPPEDFALPVTGVIPLDRIDAYFNRPVVLLHASSAAVTASVQDAEVEGYWTTEPTIVGCIGATISELTS